MKEGVGMKELELQTIKIRKMILDMIYKAKTGHIGGDFSVVDILAVLYLRIMNISKDNLEDQGRDYFVLSKGHAVEAYYSVLCEAGILVKEEVMDGFSAFGTPYIGHPNNKLAGIEMNSGSLGHGLPVCVGIALAAKMDKRNSRVYTVMGDGELAEGSVWEGFMSASHYHLDNLCAVIDHNGLQISGTTEQVMSHEVLADKVKSFGWNVISVNGNDITELQNAFMEAQMVTEKPTCIIANTVKGYGGGEIMEGKVNWHHKVPTEQEYQQILNALEARKEEILHE